MPRAQVTGLVPASLALSEVSAEPEAVIEGWLPTGVITLMAAEPKAGKTTFAWHMAEAVLTGTPFAGREIVQPGPVLWVASDTSWRHELKTRHADERDGLYVPDESVLEGLKSYGVHKAAWQSAMKTLGEAAKAVGARLIVIDHLLGFAMNDGGVDKPEFVNPWLTQVAQVAEQSGAAVLVIMHNNNSGQIAHSYAIRAIPRHILRVKRGRGRKMSVTTKGNLYPDASYTFAYVSPEVCKFEADGTEPESPEGSGLTEERSASRASRRASQLEAVRADLAEAPAGLSTLAQATWLREQRGYTESVRTLTRRIDAAAQ